MKDEIRLSTWSVTTAATAVGAGTIAPYTVEGVRKNSELHEVVLDQIPLEMQQAVGQAIINHALMEWALVGLLCLVAGIDRRIGRIALGNPRGETILQRIRQICLAEGLKLPKLPDENRIKTAKSNRDLLGHGIWLTDNQNGQLCIQDTSGNWSKLSGETQSVPKRLWPEARPVTKEWIDTLTAEFRACTAAIDAGTQEMLATLGTSPNIDK